MTTTKPITPTEAAASFPPLPDAVFAVFNGLIVKNMRGGRSTVRQSDALAEVSIQTGLTEGEAIRRGFLDVESAYEAAGWNVVYDKPGFNESYEPTFTFTARAK